MATTTTDTVTARASTNGTGAESRQLKRGLGMKMATALVIGNMVGSGIFLLPASLAQTAGPISILAWLFTGIGAMMLALVFARLGRAYPKTGGPYVYARKAFGDLVGFWSGWSYWINAWVGNAAIAVAFAGYLAVFWSKASTYWVATIIAIALVWIFTAVNIAGVKQAGWVQSVTAVIKFVPLLLIGILGLFHLHSSNLHPFTTVHGFDWGISSAALLTLWAFIGLESATVPAEEVQDPETTIPRSTILGTGLTTIMYLITSVALFGMIATPVLAKSTSPFADGANVIFGGTGGGKFIAVVAMVSIAGALNGWILLQGRVPLALAKDHLFPKQFAQLDEQRQTPVLAIVASSVLVTALLCMNFLEGSGVVDLFTQIIILATLTALIPYAFSAAAELYLFVFDRASFSGVNFAKSSVISILALAYSAWAIWGAGYKPIAEGMMLLLAGIAVYLWTKWQDAKERGVEAASGEREQRRAVVEAVR